MYKSIQLITLFLLIAGSAWSQAPERNMVNEGMISGMESIVGDLNVNQEDQFILAFDSYVKASRQAGATAKRQAMVTYQNELKQILTPQKYAVLKQNPVMKKRPGFGTIPSQN